MLLNAETSLLSRQSDLNSQVSEHLFFNIMVQAAEEFEPIFL